MGNGPGRPEDGGYVKEEQAEQAPQVVQRTSQGTKAGPKRMLPPHLKWWEYAPGVPNPEDQRKVRMAEKSGVDYETLLRMALAGLDNALKAGWMPKKRGLEYRMAQKRARELGVSTTSEVFKPAYEPLKDLGTGTMIQGPSGVQSITYRELEKMKNDELIRLQNPRKEIRESHVKEYVEYYFERVKEMGEVIEEEAKSRLERFKEYSALIENEQLIGVFFEALGELPYIGKFITILKYGISFIQGIRKITSSAGNGAYARANFVVKTREDITNLKERLWEKIQVERGIIRRFVEDAIEQGQSPKEVLKEVIDRLGYFPIVNRGDIKKFGEKFLLGLYKSYYHSRAQIVVTGVVENVLGKYRAAEIRIYNMPVAVQNDLMALWHCDFSGLVRRLREEWGVEYIEDIKHSNIR